jgi:formylglycine-generating enzyme required for sulfatase activity
MACVADDRGGASCKTEHAVCDCPNDQVCVGEANGELVCKAKPPTCNCPRPDMVCIPAGDAELGGPDGVLLPEGWRGPKVEPLSAFCIDKYEVSNKLFRACVESRKCCKDASKDCDALTYENEPEGYPVTFVTRALASEYCEQAGGGLPNHNQWERAARGPNGRKNIYPWGDAMPRPVGAGGSGPQANIRVRTTEYPQCEDRCEYILVESKDDEIGKACRQECSENEPKRTRKLVAVDTVLEGNASPEGVFHMAGNVSEIVIEVDGQLTQIGEFPIKGGNDRACVDCDELGCPSPADRENLSTCTPCPSLGGPCSRNYALTYGFENHDKPADFIGFRCISDVVLTE